MFTSREPFEAAEHPQDCRQVMGAREVVAGPAIEGQRSNFSNQQGGRRWDRPARNNTIDNTVKSAKPRSPV
jgi:hypothetical protein